MPQVRPSVSYSTVKPSVIESRMGSIKIKGQISLRLEFCPSVMLGVADICEIFLEHNL